MDRAAPLLTTVMTGPTTATGPRVSAGQFARLVNERSASRTAPTSTLHASDRQVSPSAPNRPPHARRTLAVAFALALSFVAVLAMTVPSMFGVGDTEWLVVATPLAQWIPALAVLLAAWAAGLGQTVSKLWSLGPVRRSRGAGPWGRTMLIVTVALVAVPALHLGAAAFLGIVPWTTGSDTLAVAVMVVPMLVITSLSALGEEAAWRGFFWQFWRERMGVAGTVCTTTFVWVAWHVPLLAAYGVAGAMAWREIIAALISLALGSVLLGIARERGGNVWPAVLGHGLMNSWLVFANSNLVGSPVTLDDAPFWGFHALSWTAWALVLVAVAVTSRRRRPSRTR